MPKINKPKRGRIADLRELVSYFEARCKELGAVEMDIGLVKDSLHSAQMQIKTIYGLMRISCDGDDMFLKDGKVWISIYCRFDKPNHLGNPYSGKWNLHGIGKEDTEIWFERTLKPLLKIQGRVRTRIRSKVY